jgi:transposase
METSWTSRELEKRRRLAVERVMAGYSQVAVAAFLGVSQRSVRRWVKAYRDEGASGLTARPRRGRPAHLTPQQTQQMLGWFRHSPKDFGFATELWTARRVAWLIEKRFGVCFHPRYLNAWLTQRGITPQKPQKQARERDQARIDRWVAEDWPRILKKGLPSVPISS